MERIGRPKATNHDAKTPAPELDGNRRLTRAEWNQMRTDLFARQAADRDALKQQAGAEWKAVGAAIAKDKAAREAAWRKEHARQTRAVKDERRTVWHDLFKQQRAETEQSERTMRDAQRRKRFANSIVGHIAVSLGLVKAPPDRALLAWQHNQMIDRHDAERLEARKEQARIVRSKSLSVEAAGVTRSCRSPDPERRAVYTGLALQSGWLKTTS